MTPQFSGWTAQGWGSEEEEVLAGVDGWGPDGFPGGGAWRAAGDRALVLRREDWTHGDLGIPSTEVGVRPKNEMRGEARVWDGIL